MVEGTIVGDARTGGVFGEIHNSGLFRCSFSGKVDKHFLSDQEIGGLVGFAWDSEIRESHSDAWIIGRREVGGLVGRIHGTSIWNSHAEGKVEGMQNYLGGLVGYGSESASVPDSVIEHSYATASVAHLPGGSGVKTFFAGNLGLGAYSTSSTYFNEDSACDGCFLETRAEGRTTEELKRKDTFEGWDFDSVWSIDEGSSMPVLIWMK